MSGTLWLILISTVVAVIVGVIFLVMAYIYRVRLIAHRVGAFELALRHSDEEEWTSGIGLYSTDCLEWHRTVSLSLKPKYRFPRGAMLLSEPIRRSSGDVVEIEARDASGRRWLAMHSSSYTGLISWLDSAAPPEADIF